MVTAAVAFPRPSGAASDTLDVRASVVNYYSNRFIVTADGDVRVRLSDGTTLTGETFAMDLKLNRFVIAGNVLVNGPNIHEVGAAFAVYPDLDRSYLLTEGDEPDRYTYFGHDYSDPHKGRVQPGDAYALPDLSGDRPFTISRHAWIVPKTSIGLDNLRVYLYGAWVPLPSYIVNFSSNPNWAQNGFSGATADVGVPFYATKNSISTIHLRYDTVRGLYTSFDQHFVWNRDYVVASVNPLTQSQRQWNLIGYKRESPALESRLFFQLSTLSKGLSEPHDASSFANAGINTVFARHAVGLSLDQWNNDLLANPADTFTIFGLRQDAHPFDMQLAVQSYENEWRLWRYVGVPIKFQYRFGMGYYHDSYGVSTITGLDATGNFTWGSTLYPTIWQHFVGVTAYTPSITVGKQLSLSVKGDKQRQWFSLPHYIDVTNSSITLARTPLRLKEPAFYLSYGVTNVADIYGSQQLVAYPPYNCAPDPTQCGIAVTPFGSFTGLDAFRGIATSRNYTGSMIYTPTPYFALNLTLRRFYDTPAPVPGLGGQPPWQLSGDLRLRLSKTILIDLSRQYFFNFADNRWSPQFGIQFSP